MSGDVKEAKKWAEAAANQGSATGYYVLAQIYEFEENFERAFELYSESAELGLSMAEMQLADCYMNGKGVEKDLKKWFEWLQRAAENRW